jgi:hypothetical protein
MMIRNLAGVFLLALVGNAALAAPASSPTASATSPTPAAASPAPSAAGPAADSARLEPSQISGAIQTDAITIPTPGELFAALSKPGKPDWASRYRGPISINYKTRAQIALNLGGLIADGFIAIEAEYTQQVKNIGGDMMKMDRALGVSEGILARGNSINQFAENDEWSTLQEELEATQNEVKSSMQSHRDQDLIILVSLGGWIRGTQVVSGVIEKNYDEKLGQILRQPELLRFIRAKIGTIAPEMQADPLVKSVNTQLGGIEEIVAKPFGQGLTAAEVAKLSQRVNALMQEIQRKD